jgi:hypothetical protein
LFKANVVCPILQSATRAPTRDAFDTALIEIPPFPKRVADESGIAATPILPDPPVWEQEIVRRHAVILEQWVEEITERKGNDIGGDTGGFQVVSCSSHCLTNSRSWKTTVTTVSKLLGKSNILVIPMIVFWQ